MSGRASPLFDVRKDTMVACEQERRLDVPVSVPGSASHGEPRRASSQPWLLRESLGFTSLNDYLTHLAAQAVGYTPKREIQEGLSFADVA